MAPRTVSRTALGAAICRLIEQYQPEQTRLFDDPVAQALVAAPLRSLMQFAGMRSFTVKQTDAVAKGIYGAQVCRTRYVDDAVQAFLARGNRQLVILGAGLDTRTYRLPGVEKVPVFELDLPAALRDKKKKVQKRLGRLPQNITFVPIDFDTQTLETALAGTAFDPSGLAVFIWEGVTQYLSEAAVSQTLSYVGKRAPGNLIVFTYVLKSIIERRSDIPDADKLMDVVAKQAPWIFGLDPANIRAYLQPYHLAVQADVGSDDYQKQYLQPLKRTLDVFEGERIVQAIVVPP